MKLLFALSMALMACAPVNAEMLKGSVEIDGPEVRAQLVLARPKWDAAGLVEHCACMNPNKVQAVQIDGQWQLVDDGEKLAGFGDQKEAADAAVEVVKHYGFTETCWAGRSNGSDLHELRYFKTAGGVPEGAMKNENATGFDPTTVRVEQKQGTWKVISDGDNWMLDYGSDKAAAEQAADIIRIYEFKNMCFVGSPAKLMMYFRK